MNPRIIFESYIGKTIENFIYELFIEKVDLAIKKEPQIGRWEEVGDTEIRVQDLDVYNEYKQAFEELESESLYAIEQMSNLTCLPLKNGCSFYDFTESVIHEIGSDEQYKVAHKIIEYYEKFKGDTTIIKNLNQFAAYDKEIFKAIIEA